MPSLKSSLMYASTTCAELALGVQPRSTSLRARLAVRKVMGACSIKVRAISSARASGEHDGIAAAKGSSKLRNRHGDEIARCCRDSNSGKFLRTRWSSDSVREQRIFILRRLTHAEDVDDGVDHGIEGTRTPDGPRRRDVQRERAKARGRDVPRHDFVDRRIGRQQFAQEIAAGSHDGRKHRGSAPATR